MQALLIAVQAEIDLDCVQVKGNQAGLGCLRYVFFEWVVSHGSSCYEEGLFRCLMRADTVRILSPFVLWRWHASVMLPLVRECTLCRIP
jgi:hypothetical protein